MSTEQINMMMQLMMQQSQVSGSNAGKDSNGESFQDLMSQKKDAVSDTKSGSDAQKTQSDSTKNDKVQQSTGENQQENVTDVSDDVRQVMAAMLLQPYAAPQMTQENVSVSSVATAAVDTVVPQTIQTAVSTETAMPLVQQTNNLATAQVSQQATMLPENQVSTEMATPQESALQASLQQNPSAHTEQQLTGENASTPKMVEVEQSENQPVIVAQEEQPIFRDVKSMPVKVGDATPTVNVNAPDVEKQLADTIQANLNTVGDKVQIQLKPENLGHITIELVQHGSKLGLVIYADNAKTTSLLAQHAGNLGAMLEDRTGQNVQIHVQQQEAEQPQYDGHNQQNRQQQEQQSHPQQNKAEQDSFLGQLRLGLFQLDVV